MTLPQLQNQGSTLKESRVMEKQSSVWTSHPQVELLH
jgi:hypothetical protein